MLNIELKIGIPSPSLIDIYACGNRIPTIFYHLLLNYLPNVALFLATNFLMVSTLRAVR